MALGYYRLATLSYITPEKELLLQIAGDDPIAMFFTYIIAQFTNYPLNFAIYLDAFPKILPFEWGHSFIIALKTAIVPGHHGLFDEYVKAELGLDFLGGGINPTLLGELYANFGYAGLCGMSAYGAIITYLFYKAVKNNRNGINVVAYAYGLSSLLLGLIGGFFSFSLPFYYIIVITFAHLLMRRKRVQNIEPQIQ
jgi:oligosaccharide repeat unit polymerase